MKTIKLLTISFVVILFGSCQIGEENKSTIAEKSFLPMQVGNIWRVNPQNYTEIQDTMRINGELYFKFYSLIGGDAVDTKYLRIDETNQLLESYPEDPTKTYKHARFDGMVGDDFYTLGDKTENDYKVNIIEKTAKRMSFEFEMVHHPTLKGHRHTVTYIKGLGFDGVWKEVFINGKKLIAN